MLKNSIRQANTFTAGFFSLEKPKLRTFPPNGMGGGRKMANAAKKQAKAAQAAAGEIKGCADKAVKPYPAFGRPTLRPTA